MDTHNVTSHHKMQFHCRRVAGCIDESTVAMAAAASYYCKVVWVAVMTEQSLLRVFHHHLVYASNTSVYH